MINSEIIKENVNNKIKKTGKLQENSKFAGKN